MEIIKAENKEYFANKAREIAELCKNFNVPLSVPGTRPSQNNNLKPKFQGKTLKIEVPQK